ncbi:MAG: HEAT repeat domain-containing protein [Candidatus Heimdallarchaeota archaeon]
MFSLGFMKVKRATNVFLHTLQQDPSSRVRKTAALALRQLEPKTKKAIKILLEVLNKEEEAEVKEQVAATLEKIAELQGLKDINELTASLSS